MPCNVCAQTKLHTLTFYAVWCLSLAFSASSLGKPDEQFLERLINKRLAYACVGDHLSMLGVLDICKDLRKLSISVASTVVNQAYGGIR